MNFTFKKTILILIFLTASDKSYSANEMEMLTGTITGIAYGIVAPIGLNKIIPIQNNICRPIVAAAIAKGAPWLIAKQLHIISPYTGLFVHFDLAEKFGFLIIMIKTAYESGKDLVDAIQNKWASTSKES